VLAYSGTKQLAGKGENAMRIIVIRARTLAAVAVGLVVCLCVGVLAVQYFGGARMTAGQLEKHPIYSVDTQEAKVALGINCAWDNADIPKLISVLEQYNVKATFFVVGDWCDKYPESVKALYNAGHEIGSHSDTHADMAKLDEAGIVRELEDSADKIEAITGRRPNLFRPPSGSYSSEMIAIVEREGFYPIQWDCDSIDYKDPTAAQMQERILKKLRNGSIMLFHSGAANTPDALPQIIEAVRAKGYVFVPVSQLIYTGSYTVDYEGRQHVANE